MKYILTFTLITCIPLLGLSQYAFRIKANTPQHLNGHKIYLSLGHEDIRNNESIIDSLVISDCHFQFNGEINAPLSRATLYLKKNKIRNSSRFVLDSGLNIINLTNSGNIEDEFIINVYNSKSNKIKHDLDSISSMYLIKHRKETNQLTGPISLPADYKNLQDNDYLEVITKNPSEYYSLFRLYEVSLYPSMYFRPGKVLETLNSLSKELQSTKLGLLLKTKKTEELNSLNSVKIGKQVPEFRVKTFNGKYFRNTELKGAFYIIAFSATWCVPCQEVEKKLKLLHQKYDRLKVVYFNLDDNINIWRKHIQEKKLNWINVSERTKFKDSKIAIQFHVAAIPMCLIIDKNGTIIYNSDELEDVNFMLLEKCIQKLLMN